MKKRLCSMLLAFSIVLSLLPVSTMAAGNGETASPAIHYYEIFDHVANTWEDAQLYCVSLGGHLATLTSQEENDYVYQKMLDAGYTSAYFGLSDRDEEGIWKWITGEQLNYQNWHSSEPNSENSNEDYAMFYYKYSDGTWNDGDFDGKTVICEWDTKDAYDSYLTSAGSYDISTATEDEMYEQYFDASITYNGHRYALSNVVTTWNAAKTLCESMGGHLVTITTEDEQNAVMGLFEGANSLHAYWMGAYHDGDWKWVTGEEFDYSNWHPGEPNGGTTDFYAQIFADDLYTIGKWDDTWNDGDHGFGIKQQGFICEWDNLEATTVTPTDTDDIGSITGTFNYLSYNNQIREYTYLYNDSWFFNSSYNYQHDLVKMSIRAAMAAFDTVDIDAATRTQNITSLMDNLGFNYTEDSIHYDARDTDSIGYAIGSKNITSDSGETCSLVFVAVRGGGYGPEWGGNFRLGTIYEQSLTHVGFLTAATQVEQGLYEYLQQNQQILSPDIKIWMVGYSRAAATTNLVAAHLIDYGVSALDMENSTETQGQLSCEIQPEDIFAFCFECPRNTMDSQASDERYSNIVNIINPIDFVPKVAMASWKYQRYGTDYYLPSVESTSDYTDLKQKMIRQYQDILTYPQEGWMIDPSNDYSQLYYEADGQAGILDDFMVNLSNAMSDPMRYTEKYQEDMITIGAAGLGGADIDVSFDSLVGPIGNLLIRHPKNTIATVELFAVLDGGVSALFRSSDSSGLLKKIFESLDFTGPAACAHYPELCLAWLDALEGDTDYIAQTYRKIFINCPVDVSVYDGNMQLVAQITGDTVQDISNGIVAYVDDNEQKVMILPNDEEYTIKLRATDDGTVTYTVTEYNADASVTEKVVSYYNVHVKNTDELVGIVENLDEVDSATYSLSLKDESENVLLFPSITQTGDSVQEYSVDVSASGNGSAIGSGTFVSGEFVKVTATADAGAKFLGWYLNNSLVSTNSEYRFLVTQDVSITAKFTAAALPFTDVAESDWFYDAVAYVYEKGMMNGTSQVTFSPGMTTSRAMIVTILYRLEGEPAVSHTSAFADVAADTWYTDAVTWAAANGIVNGYGNGSFGPNDAITREQMAAILYRYAGCPTTDGDLRSFVDADNVSEYAVEAMRWATEAGLIAGMGDGTLAPQGNATRAQAATILMRYIENVL